MPDPVQPSLQRIAAASARALGLALPLVLGRCRRRAVARARHLAWYVAHERCGYGYAGIGRLSERDHTSVLCGVKRVAATLPHDPALAAALAAVVAELARPAPPPIAEPAPARIANPALAVAPPDQAPPPVTFARRERRSLALDVDDREVRRWCEGNNARFVAAMRDAHPEVEIKPWLGVAPRRAPAVGAVA